jgi:hypothetical protein
MYEIMVTIVTVMIVNFASAATPADVDVVRSFSSDIFGDSKPAIVTLRIYGKEKTRPFKWSVTVEKSSRIIFSTTHDDEWLDKFFSDEGYVEGCTGYTECKRKWYFSDLPLYLRNSLEKKNNGGKSIEKWEIDTLKEMADNFLKKKGLDRAHRSAVLKEMINLFSGSYVSFCPPYTSVHQEACYMFVPSLGYFVPYWAD